MIEAYALLEDGLFGQLPRAQPSVPQSDEPTGYEPGSVEQILDEIVTCRAELKLVVVERDAARHTLVQPYNDLESVRRMVRRRWKSIACIIVEPVAGNMGVVPPAPGFLEGLRKLTKRHGIVLIFDEVITGFRLCYGGAQTLFGIRPDLTCLGKIIGGGLPVGAYGGRRKIMKLVSPSGPVYQAGTLSGNPLAVAAGLAQLKTLRTRKGIYRKLEESGRRLESAFQGMTVNRMGSMLTPFFTNKPVTDWRLRPNFVIN